mgnify:FL=1
MLEAPPKGHKKLKMNDNINKFFGLEETNNQITIQPNSDISVIEPGNINNEEIEDYNLARENITKITELGMKSLEEITDLAPKLQNYKAYEAVSTLVKSLVDANKDLAELSRKKSQLSKYDDDPPSLQPTTITNNNMFVGTTAELIEMIKNKKKDE